MWCLRHTTRNCYAEWHLVVVYFVLTCVFRIRVCLLGEYERLAFPTHEEWMLCWIISRNKDILGLNVFKLMCISLWWSGDSFVWKSLVAFHETQIHEQYFEPCKPLFPSLYTCSCPTVSVVNMQKSLNAATPPSSECLVVDSWSSQ